MISEFLLMLILITTSSLVLLLLGKKVQARKLPPGPERLPLIGNLHQLSGNHLLHVSLQQLSNDYGPLMFLQLGSIPTLVISSADVARDVFKTHDLIFSGKPKLFAAKNFSYNCSNITFAPYGDYWREIRKIAILELLSSKRVQSFQEVRNEEVANMLEFITRSSGPIDLSRLIFLLANNIVCRVTFGKIFDSGADTGTSRFDDLMREMQALMGESSIADFFPWMEWLNKFNGREARMRKTFREIDRLYDEEIKQHLDPGRPKPEHEDLVDVLFGIQKDSTQAITLSNEQIKGILMVMLGHICCGDGYFFSHTRLDHGRACQESICDEKSTNEVRRVGKGKEVVEEDDLSKLTYLKLVVKEALRLHPPAPLLVPRETTEDCMVGEYRIPSGTRVFINAKAIATDPKYWENPYEFQPDRFLNSSIDFKGQNFELIPFGVGRRGCPGMHFAIPLVELALANLLHCFDWKLPLGMRIEDLDMEEAYGITVHKSTPLCVVATPAN